MTPLEAVEKVLAENGSVSNEKLAVLVKKKFGIQIELKYLPLYRATIQEKVRAERVRQEARNSA